MAKTTQLVLSLKSKPGVLAGISRALADALSDWRKEDTTERECAGEFCDLIERLP